MYVQVAYWNQIHSLLNWGCNDFYLFVCCILDLFPPSCQANI